MANLVELSNELEDFPEQQLVQMSQDPNSMYPSYLVLSEIQRRNQMRKMYDAQQPKPQTTVAEEVVQEFAGQQGLQGAMAQSPGPQNAFPPSDMGNMAPPSPQMGMPSQQMMDGGLTEYAQGGRTGYQIGGFIPTADNPYPTGSELVSDTFTSSGTDIGLGADIGLSETIPIESLSESQRKEILEKSEGLSTSEKIQFGLGAASLLLLATPAPGARIAAGATKLLQLGTKAGSGLKKIYDAKRAQRLLKAGQKELTRRGGLPATTPYNPNTVIQTGREALRRDLAPKIIGGSTLAGVTIPPVRDYFTNDTNDVDDSAPSDKKPTNELLNTILNKDKETKRKGLGDPLDLARLGFTIMGARNTSELASGLGGLVSDIQGRDKEVAEQEYIRAQTDALVANANMKLPDQYYKLASTYGAQIKALFDAGKNEQAAALSNELSQIQAAYAKALGLNILTQEEQDAAALQALGIGNA